MGFKQLKLVVMVAAAFGIAGAAQAKGTPEEIAKLGKSLTCVGAEKAGSPSGVAEFTGKWNGAAPGMVTEPGKHQVDPYASEKPTLVITAQNYTQHAEKLSEGQKALFKKFPNSFKMNIYPSHRDFRMDDSMCKAFQANAEQAELAADGLSVNNGHKGAAPFPFPKSGLEVVWNGVMPPRSSVEFRDTDIAIVQPSGSIIWGAQLMWGYSRQNDPKLRGTKYEGKSAYNRLVTVLPEREKGAMTLTIDSFTMKPDDARLAWQYIPATRRIRQAPNFGYDILNPSSANTVTIDETRIFNGAADRYNWKLIGKKEMYIPYNGFKLESKAAGESKYAKLLTPGHESPEFVRWELHRVWVVEGKLKDGFRHLYPHRVFYLDEDSWQFVMSDSFDGQGALWRYNWINNIFLPGPNIFNQTTAFYHDVISGAYTAYDLTQGRPQTVVVDMPGAEYSKLDFYSQENLKAGGY